MDDHRWPMRPTPPLRPPCNAPRAPRAGCHHCPELERATRLLERCEAFLPENLKALREDVRGFLQLDDRGVRRIAEPGVRVVPTE